MTNKMDTSGWPTIHSEGILPHTAATRRSQCERGSAGSDAKNKPTGETEPTANLVGQIFSNPVNVAEGIDDSRLRGSLSAGISLVAVSRIPDGLNADLATVPTNGHAMRLNISLGWAPPDFPTGFCMCGVSLAGLVGPASWPDQEDLLRRRNSEYRCLMPAC